MIEKMKVVQIVSSNAKKDQLLQSLRELGILHLSEKKACNREYTDRFESLSRICLLLQEQGIPQEKEILDDQSFEALFTKISNAIEQKKALESQRNTLHATLDQISSFGDVSSKDLQPIYRAGISLYFYRVDKKTLEKLKQDDSVSIIVLSPMDGMNLIAMLNPLPSPYSGMDVVLPEKSSSELQNSLQQCEASLASYNQDILDAAKYVSTFQSQMLKTQNDAEYSSVSNTTSQEDSLVWLQGYIPAEQVDVFKETAAKNHWAWAMDDPEDDDDKVPTKVKYNKLTRLMIPVFDILGTVPGYHEYDISFWFLAFFTLFFAMIVGDAGYGCIFLIGAIVLTIKTKKAGNATMLLWVLSVATILWGAITGTWFGLEGAMKVPLLKSLVVPAFANYPEYFGVTTSAQQNNIMKFCFILGTIQLSLACIMNIKRKVPDKDLSLFADLGWLLAIDALYFVVLYLVIGQNVNLIPVAAIVILGFLMVVFFGGMSPDKSFSQGLKSGLGNAFTVFLNTISAFGNIMSYIRLFAVGMASLAIAQSFNNMASGFDGPLIIVGAIIMIIGHVLNIIMGLLSVVVHGVRLNLLEFSGQLGMEWAGIAYNPFKKSDKIKK